MDIGSTQKTLLPVEVASVSTPYVAAVAKPAPAVAKSEVQPAPATKEQLEGAVATIQDFVQTVQRSLNFAVDDSSGQVVVKVTDSDSGDVIRQIPSEDALQLAENLNEVRSLLFKAEA
jgi:flagellar protein FlaG